MTKLIFRYGAMGSSKTANALMVRYNYVEKGKKVILLKPKCEDRDGAKIIKSRIGLEEPCEFAEDFLDQYSGEHYDCVIVDEVQFLSESIIDRLSDLVDDHNITVICYGLRTTSRVIYSPERSGSWSWLMTSSRSKRFVGAASEHTSMPGY